MKSKAEKIEAWIDERPPNVRKVANKYRPDICYFSFNEAGIKFKLTKSEIAILWDRDRANEMNSPTLDRINSDGDYDVSNCRFIERVLNGYLGGLRRHGL